MMTHFFPDKESVRLLDTRRPQLLAALARVVERRHWSRTKLETFQTATLRSLLARAFERVPFYRTKYLAAGFHPDTFRDLGDLERIPLLTKDELRAATVETLKSSDRNGPSRLLSTSGSTGVPLRMFRSEESLWHFSAANVALYFDWCDRRPIENVLYFLDPSPDGIDFAMADLLRSMVMADRIVSAFEPVEALVETLAEVSPEFISSYPSTLRNIAVHLDRRDRRCECVKLLHVTSEMTTESTRRLFGRVFPQARLVDTYTTTEAGLVGFECRSDGGFHVAEDGVLVEIVGGRTVVTDLTNFSTPIIRYDGLGDLCRWDNRPCGCGSALQRIAHLEGRFVDSITLRDGGTQSPYALTNALDAVAGLYGYQLIQHGVGRFELVAVMNRAAAASEQELREQGARAVTQALGEACELDIRFVERIEPPPDAHKVPLVISKLRRTQ